MARDKIYTEKDYKSKLLQLERRLIMEALKRCEGVITNAHKLLCPKGYPYTYNALVKVIKKHGL